MFIDKLRGKCVRYWPQKAIIKDHFWCTFLLTLSLLGYLKTRICWGGGQTDLPPSKSHVLCPNMTNDTSLESSCALLLESAKNLHICKNWIFYRKIQLNSKNVRKQKFVQKMKNYTFLKISWPCHFKYAKIFANFK